eukprot:6622706-Pyramimonas_sp.AAC.1
MNLLPRFQSLREFGEVECIQPPGPPRVPGLEHKWLHLGTFWRCSCCLEVVRREWPRKPCPS